MILPLNKGGLFWRTWSASPRSDALILVNITSFTLWHPPPFHFLLPDPQNKKRMKYCHVPTSQGCSKSPRWEISKWHPSFLAAAQQILRLQEKPSACCNYWDSAETRSHGHLACRYKLTCVSSAAGLSITVVRFAGNFPKVFNIWPFQNFPF